MRLKASLNQSTSTPIVGAVHYTAVLPATDLPPVLLPRLTGVLSCALLANTDESTHLCTMDACTGGASPLEVFLQKSLRAWAAA
jgi:hypothetical protein